MLDEFKKSISLVLRERITSPFSGAFIFSWFVWNWKIPYALLFSDEQLDLLSRINIIETQYLSWYQNLLLPIVSTLFFIIIYPFITTDSLWIWLKFKKFKTDIKNSIEGQMLLTLDQSIALRLELDSQNQRLDKLTKAKDDEILFLKKNEELKKD